MKTLTRKQLTARKAQAVRFVRDVLGDDDKADDIEDEALEDYAEHRHIKRTNPKGATHMAAPVLACSPAYSVVWMEACSVDQWFPSNR